MAQARPRKAKTPRKAGGLVWQLFKWGFIIFVAIPILWVAVLKFVPPPVTLTMLEKAAQGRGLDYRWRSVDRISPNLVNAAIAAEDARFCSHMGFDVEAIEKALANNEKRPSRIRGGSTISQQTAKNVFLWQHRDWFRKGLETYFTGLIEVIWGKRRIIEVYLNVAEMGPGLYGAEAAAQRYFNKSAATLTPAQASRLVAVLPNPIRYKAGTPGPYVQRRTRRIGGAAGQVRREGLSACVLKPGRRGDAPPPAEQQRAKPRPSPASAPPQVVDTPVETQPLPEPPPADTPPAEAVPEQPAPDA